MSVCCVLQIITFIIIAFVIYFCVVVPVGAALNKYYVSAPSFTTHITYVLMSMHTVLSNG